jgi:YggT family protein
MTGVTTALGVLPLALSRNDVATYVSALFVVYTILILLNILISFVPRMPYTPWLRAVLDFITESTDPYLNIFRRLLRPIGGAGGFAFDLSPILALIVLGIAEGIVVGALS